MPPQNPASLREQYELRAQGDPIPPSTIGELSDRFLRHCKATYPDRGRRSSSTFTNARDALKPLNELYADEPPSELTAVRLRAVQLRMIDLDLCRRTINDRISRIRWMFRWASVQGWVSDELAVRLMIPPVKREGRQSIPKFAVPLADVIRTLQCPRLGKTVKAMIGVQLFSGMRPGEVCQMQGREIEQAETPWLYRPVDHKNAWRGKPRVIPLWPRAQLALMPFMRDGWLFTTKYGNPFCPDAYRTQVVRACARLHIPSWSPQQIRKRTATEAAKLSIEAAQEVLGHSDKRVTEKYVDRCGIHAAKFMEGWG